MGYGINKHIARENGGGQPIGFNRHRWSLVLLSPAFPDVRSFRGHSGEFVKSGSQPAAELLFNRQDQVFLPLSI
jgi:hypothetical protein